MRNHSARAAFIAQHLAATTLPDLGGMRLYLAQPGSGLSRLGAMPPYWAYVWAGGAALARYFRDEGQLVRGRRVLDLGAGSGVVGIAAALAGASDVRAVEANPWGRTAVMLNAALNGVSIRPARGLPAVDLVLAGDVFYAPDVAAKVLPMLDALRAKGAKVLIGDPGRADLPVARLEPLASYDIRDTGDGPGITRQAGVYRLLA